MKVELNIYTFKEKLPTAGEEVYLVYEGGVYPYKVFDRIQELKEWVEESRACDDIDSAEEIEADIRDILDNGRSVIGLEDYGSDCVDVIPFEDDEGVLGWFYPNEIIMEVKNGSK